MKEGSEFVTKKEERDGDEAELDSSDVDSTQKKDSGILPGGATIENVPYSGGAHVETDIEFSDGRLKHVFRHEKASDEEGDDDAE